MRHICVVQELVNDIDMHDFWNAVGSADLLMQHPDFESAFYCSFYRWELYSAQSLYSITAYRG
jgi:hypothetical protein